MFYLATYRRFPVFRFPCFILTTSTELFQGRRATAYAIFDAVYTAIVRLSSYEAGFIVITVFHLQQHVNYKSFEESRGISKDLLGYVRFKGSNMLSPRSSDFFFRQAIGGFLFAYIYFRLQLSLVTQQCVLGFFPFITNYFKDFLWI